MKIANCLIVGPDDENITLVPGDEITNTVLRTTSSLNRRQRFAASYLSRTAIPRRRWWRRSGPVRL